MRVGIAQINPTVGDFEGNAKKILEYIEKAREVECDVVAFPELVLTGYPPEDLLLKPKFIEENLKKIKEIASKTKDIVAIIGFVDKKDDIYNAAAIIYDGEIKGVHHKHYLPNYTVFDEKRYFQEGKESYVYQYGECIFGVTICEDIWIQGGTLEAQVLGGDVEIIFSINASPYHVGKWEQRREMLSTRANDNSIVIVYANMVGGQDELVFDGHSMVINEYGELIAEASQFEEDFIACDIDRRSILRKRLHDPRRREAKEEFLQTGQKVKRIILKKDEYEKDKKPLPSYPRIRLHETEEIYRALCVGLRDYIKKNGFKKVVIGLSGGIDSALTAVIAVDALGKENVTCVYMPSMYSSKESKEDAEKLAKNLGVKFLEIPITDIYNQYMKVFGKVFKGLPVDKTEENLQARIRGNILMALSNKFGWIVLSTGNKSEMSVGYATLYGDMCGGFNVLKDVPKTLVYKLAHYRNTKSKVIPDRILKKPPSAELRPNQRDEDELAPYELLDPIVQLYVEEDRSMDEIIKMGFEEKLVKKVVSMIDKNEYKRRQSPPGIKITPRAFGKDRRMPITNKFIP